MNISSLLYSAVTLPVSLVATPFFLASARGRARFWDRFGYWDLDVTEPVDWFHGASFGELKGIVPVVSELRQLGLVSESIYSCVSSSALETAGKYFSHVRILPFDVRAFYERALAHTRVKHFIFFETEIWPGLIAFLKNRGAKVYLVNGLMTETSSKRYGLIPKVFKNALSGLDYLCASDQRSLERFVELGVAANRAQVTGNAKYETTPSLCNVADILRFKRDFFVNDNPVIVLGSLRPGEEKFWFPALKRAWAAGRQFNLIVAPRHKEKYGFFAEKLRENGIEFCLRSAGKQASGPVMFLDTFGELEKVYSFSSLAFIGGSLENWGGHNPLEPAMYACLPVLGPYTHKIEPVMTALQAAQAVVVVNNAAEIENLLSSYFNNRDGFRVMGQAAQQVWREQQGVAKKVGAALKAVW